MTRSRLAVPKDDLPPGSRVTLRTTGRRGIIMLNHDGTLYAVNSLCPHQLAPLDQGEVTGANVGTGVVGEFTRNFEGRILRCPWHRWEFDLETGACLAEPRRRVRTYEVHDEDTEFVVYA